MPWKECNKMNEKVKFIARLLDGERMTDLCKEFGISRKTGYSIRKKYENNGTSSFYEQSRSAVNRPNQTSTEVTNLIIELRETHKTWGAPKIKAYLENKHSQRKIPAKSTIHKILCSHDLVKKKKRRKNYRRKAGHRQDQTVLRIVEVSPMGTEPKAASVAKAAPAKTADKAEDKAAAPKKAAAKTPAAKKADASGEVKKAATAAKALAKKAAVKKAAPKDTKE